MIDSGSGLHIPCLRYLAASSVDPTNIDSLDDVSRELAVNSIEIVDYAHACESDDTEMTWAMLLKYLASHKLPWNEALSAAFVVACWANNEDIVHHLSECSGVDIKYGDGDALRRAIAANNADVVKFLIDKLCDKSLVIMNDNEFIINACQIGNLEVVKMVEQAGGDVRARNDEALKQAASAGHKDIVMLLIERGADVSVDDYAPMRWAAGHGHTHIVELLLDAGCNVNARESWALRKSAEAGHLETVKLLLSRGADVHAKNDWPLCGAVGQDHFDVMIALIDAGANICARDCEAITIASEKGFIEIVRELLDRGCHVHARNDYCVKWSSCNGHYDVTKFLIERGANVSINYNEPIRLAAAQGFTGTYVRLFVLLFRCCSVVIRAWFRSYSSRWCMSTMGIS